MAITPTARGYQLPNGQWVAPTEAFGFGENPYDPETQPALYQQWQFDHQGDAQQIGQDYSGKRVGAIIGGTVAGGALADYLAGAGAAGVGSGSAGANTVGFGQGLPAGLEATGAYGLPSTAAPLSAIAGGAGTTSGGVLGTGTAASATAPTLAASSVPSIAAGSLPGAVAPSAISAAPAAGFVGYPSTAAAGYTTAAGDLGGLGGATAPVAGGSFMNQLARYIGPAASVAQTVIGRNATNTARDQLVTATTKAATDLRNLYGNTANTLGGITQRQQQNLSPYVSLGSGAASLLGAGLGVPVAPPPPAQPFTPGNPFTAPPPSMQIAPGPNGLVPTGQTLAPSFQPGVSSPIQSNQRMVPPSATPGGGAMRGVRMQAPTGEMGIVPPEQVAAAQAKGAKIVSA